ncbi:hypothetical protein HNR46_004122 [Haloferula luteola]|uniref:Uncharacterized protein n=2 Tax=Haloferula luteola TaxID=595692 RepID=A0A840VGY9_9BACT|nr:hypothetical protein [Haloferula luteola]
MSSGNATHNSISPENSSDSDSWEPAGQDKGIVARACFYMAVRYDGSDANTTDLTLDEIPSSASNRMGVLSVLLNWNRHYPPLAGEQARNQSIFQGVLTATGFYGQHNRNPFVDYPQLADAAFLESDVLTWAKWQVMFFAIDQLDVDHVSGLTSDPDEDGFENLIEFVLRTDPLNPINAPTFQVSASQDLFTITYRQVNDLVLSSIATSWEMSMDLTHWLPMNPNITPVADEGDATTLRLEQPIGTPPAFWRMRITHLPP